MYRVCTNAESTEWFHYKAHDVPFCNCSAGPSHYVCTRPIGHDGLHLAHNSTITLASWENSDIGQFQNNERPPESSIELDPKYIITPYKDDIS
jgi:hypothetical protein